MPRARSNLHTRVTLINDFVGTPLDGCLWFLLDVFMVIRQHRLGTFATDGALPRKIRASGVIYRRRIFVSLRDELRNEMIPFAV